MRRISDRLPPLGDVRGGQGQANTAANPGQNHRGREKLYWGKKIRPKRSHMVRLCFSNINNIGQTALSHKSLDIQDFVTRREVDVFGMTELGVNWKTIPMEDNLWERTSQWFNKRRISCGYNTHDTSGRRSQYGGTALLAVNDIVNKINTCGTDSSGLGRWSWILMRGKHQTVTRIISAYCPVQSNKKGAAGQRTVSAQHIAVLHSDPIERFFTDLTQDIK